MGNSRHIFVQIDTDSLALEALANPNAFQSGNTEELCKLVRPHTMLFDQGSMSMGSSTTYFKIKVEGDQDLFFTILPVQLFTHHKLHFTEFVCTEDNGIGIPQNKSMDGHAVSFNINTGKVSNNGSATFILNAVLEFDGFSGKKVTIPLCIDPELKVDQTPDPPTAH
jgi:hypothetical protein